MKPVILSLGLGVLCLVAASNPVLAGVHDQACFALDVKPHFSATKAIPTLCDYSPTNPAANGGSAVPCSNYTVQAATNVFPGQHVFLVVGRLGSVGVLGVSAGIDYDGSAGVGLDPAFVTWTACTDGNFYGSDPPPGGPVGWPRPGSGFRITYLTCQNQDIPPDGVHALVGAFYTYAYSPDVLRVTPNNTLQSGPELAVTSCGGGTTQLIDVLAPYGGVDPILGKIGYGNTAGYAPCGVIDPARPTTWGKLKGLYRGD